MNAIRKLATPFGLYALALYLMADAAAAWLAYYVAVNQ
jgi:hypothetical protein